MSRRQRPRQIAVGHPCRTAHQEFSGWAFDDGFSAFAVQGVPSKIAGQFTRAELAPLAKVNIESLKEYDYFTYATADGVFAP